MQLELFFKKEYVCKIPSRRLKHFRHILHKANDLANLLCKVTDVTASDIRKFVTNLQIFESYHISNKIPDDERYSSIANILTIFT